MEEPSGDGCAAQINMDMMAYWEDTDCSMEKPYLCKYRLGKLVNLWLQPLTEDNIKVFKLKNKHKNKQTNKKQKKEKGNLYEHLPKLDLA